MSVTIEAVFESQARQAAGRGSMCLELDDGSSTTREQLLKEIAEQGGATLASFLLDETGAARPTVLVFQGDRMLAPNETLELKGGDPVVITSLISGG